MGMSVETVLSMVHYENFVSDYEREYFRLNRKET